MNTDIEYLKLLERDLEDAVVRERSHGARPAATPAVTRPGHRWARVAGVAAAFLVVAAAIGFVAGGTGLDGADGSGGAPERFQDFGNAVEGVGDATTDGAAPPMASPAPVEDEALGGFDEEHSFGITGGGQRSGQTPPDLSKIVRDGRIGITVNDGSFGEAVDDVTLIAERSGGFVLSSSTQNERSGTFVLRIPARRFDRARAEIRELGDVRFEEVQGDDVTAEFIDFKTRLSVLEQRRALLRGLLDDATTTDEILRLSSLVEDVQLRIEGIQGQLRFINDQVAEATLRVSVQERNAPNTEPRESVQNPNLGSAWDLAIQGFLRIVSAVIVGLGYLIPLTILAAILWVGAVVLRRRREG
jgi:hypothetical protein